MQKVNVFDILKWCFEVLVLFSVFDIYGLFIAYIHFVLEISKRLGQHIVKTAIENEQDIRDFIANMLESIGFKLVDLSTKI